MLEYNLNENVQFNAESNLYRGVTDGFTDVGLKFGVSYFFGGVAAPAVAPAPVAVDSDGDGVEDRLDKCADTPRTDKVDSEVPAPISGIITEIRFQKDAVVEV